MIRQREIDSLELVNLYIERFEELDPAINAVVSHDFDGALCG